LNHQKLSYKNCRTVTPNFGGIFDIDVKQSEIDALQQKTTEPNFWTDNIAAQKVMHEINSRKSWVDSWISVKRMLDDAQTLIELSEESQDESLQNDI